MQLKRVVFSALVGIVLSRPHNEQGGSDSNSIRDQDNENRTDYGTSLHVSMNINSEELSGYLRCAACLIECVSVKNPLSYFLCRSCIESCSNQTDSFMHFFTSHQCKVIPRRENIGSPSTPNEILGSPLWNDHAATIPSTTPGKRTVQNRASNGRDHDNFLDDYMENHFFSDENDEERSATKEKFREIETKLAQCRTDLGNCYSQWPQPQQPPAYDYGGNPYQIDYPEYDYPDRERSNIPSSSEQSRTVATDYPHDDYEMLNNIPATSTALEDDSYYMSNDTENVAVPLPSEPYGSKEDILQIINRYKSMFVSQEEYEELSVQKWGKDSKKVANIKSLLRQPDENVEEERKKAVCPTRYSVKAPKKAAHKSGTFSVQVLQDEEWKQPFIYAECFFRQPPAHSLSYAECLTVPVQRLALVIIEDSKLHMFNNCTPHGAGRHVCRDWINIPGACSLYL